MGGGERIGCVLSWFWKVARRSSTGAVVSRPGVELWSALSALSWSGADERRMAGGREEVA